MRVLGAVLVALIVSLQIACTVSNCTQGDLRLVGGSGNYEGNLQVCHNNVWGWVCHDSWDNSDAMVACRQMGFSTTNAFARYSSYYGHFNGTRLMNYLYCGGNEDKLVDCNKGYALGDISNTCGFNELAAVVCPFGGGCTQGDIRLMNFYTNSYSRSEGRVEVCYNDEWGTVCNNYWSGNDATVACKQLGYDGYFNYYSYSYYGQGTGSIWLNYLNCNGGESSLFNCPNSLGNQNCNHYYDVGVRCYSTDSDPCTNDEFRLWSAHSDTPKYEGVMQICKNNRWYAVHDSSYCGMARVVCKSLGYAGAKSYRSNAGLAYGYYNYRDNRYWYCSSYANSLSSCYFYYTSNSYYDHMGVVCHDNGGSNCNSGDVRLVNGKASNEGRVEYCYQGSWSPTCSLNSYTATLMCQKLGYTDYTWGKIFSDDEFGRSESESLFNYIYCNSAHTDLSECYTYTKGSDYGCYISSYACGTEYGLRCYNDTNQCKDGDVRLVDGRVDQEGRPEVCINGIWGSICDYSWSSIDGYIFCNELGFDGPSPNIYYNSRYDDGYGPAVWSYVNCQGWEKNVFECTKNIYPNAYCDHTRIAGVLCKEACEYGDVRLVGGGFSNEGTVETCYNNVWGQISDKGWTDGDATVVCNQLGHSGGIAKPIHDSFYGKGRRMIVLKDVSCTGYEERISDCTKTELYYDDAIEALNSTEVAGVDCIYNEPTEPPCIVNPNIDPSDACNVAGSFRLSGNSEGRVEYCYNGFWSPLCTMDHRMAVVACSELGYNQYTWGSVIEDGSYGKLLNYSLVQNVTCTGSETTVSNCTAYPPDGNCLPWCPTANVGLKCFDPIVPPCKEGSVRLMDGAIDQEGRVEVCINSVWGVVCDDQWDKTDAHVVCQQLGHPELEPISFVNSYFGAGQYPIVYSNMRCGGWETNLIDCIKETSFTNINCSRNNIAGVLCGYDCQDGDVRLVGGADTSEGTVEVCHDNLWGLVSEEGWTDTDAQVVCTQLGYESEGTMSLSGSHYGKPNKAIHMSNVQCHGQETTISHCIKTTYSLMDGKEKAKTDDVAGVKCNVPTDCVPPPTQMGTLDCLDKEVRLVGENAKDGEGALEYCYMGSWTKFCSLGTNEAALACKQLGYNDLPLASIFMDGRFNAGLDNVNSSYIRNITCGDLHLTDDLRSCTLIDSCQATCDNTVGLKCFGSAGCEDGAVRLMGGAIDQEGRVEVCHSNVWGSICGDGFDLSDAYVVCKELGLGSYRPTLASFGDGNVPIAYSKVQCDGYETSIFECAREEFGDFQCARDTVAGVICQDGCSDGEVKLSGGSSAMEGTVEICYRNLWGLVLTTDWDDDDTAVACATAGFARYGATGFIDSRYGKPNKTVHLSNVACNGSEATLSDCEAAIIPFESGRNVALLVDIVGVSCMSMGTSPVSTGTSDQISQVVKDHGITAGLAIACVLLIIIVIVVVSLAIYLFYKKSSNNKMNVPSGNRGVTMSNVEGVNSDFVGGNLQGVANPLASPENGFNEEDDDDFDVDIGKAING